MFEPTEDWYLPSFLAFDGGRFDIAWAPQLANLGIANPSLIILHGGLVQRVAVCLFADLIPTGRGIRFVPHCGFTVTTNTSRSDTFGSEVDTTMIPP